MKQARLFLLASFTASYAAIQKQQSVQLFLGVASGKLHLPEIIQGAVSKKQQIFADCFFEWRLSDKHIQAVTKEHVF